MVASSTPHSAGAVSRVFTVEVLTIGDELCRGEIVDTSSSWLAERLTDLGSYVRYRSSVTDDASDLLDAIKRAANRVDLVVCTGGLGPTDDDRTVESVAQAAGVTVVSEPAHEARLRERFLARGVRLTDSLLRQTRVPSGATVLPNEHGLAPGFVVVVDGAEVACMPGVPREMKPMFDAHLAPRVLARCGSATVARRRVWRVAGMGESHVDTALAGLLDGIDGATLHFRLAFPETLVTVVARAADEAAALATLATLDASIRQRLGEHCYGTGETTLAATVGELLGARGQTLATAESCTGGMVGELLTATPGSSVYYLGGVVSYANSAKVGLLGVREATLAAHGAVSEATVIEMAEGARQCLGATWGLSVSGVAGPGGGSAEKPVGTVHLALAGPGGTYPKKIYWPGARDQIRQIAAISVLHLLYKNLRATT